MSTQGLKLVYFAGVRERIGKPEETVELPATITNVADLLEWLKARGGKVGPRQLNTPKLTGGLPNPGFAAA